GVEARARSPAIGLHCVLVLPWRRRAPFTGRRRRAYQIAASICAPALRRHDDLQTGTAVRRVRAESVSRSQPWADTRNSFRTLRSVAQRGLPLNCDSARVLLTRTARSRRAAR